MKKALFILILSIVTLLGCEKENNIDCYAEIIKYDELIKMHIGLNDEYAEYLRAEKENFIKNYCHGRN